MGGGRAMQPDIPDDQLEPETCAKDTDAFFARLLHRYRRPLVNLAYQLLGDRDEAEDVAQETFVQAYLHLKRFRRQSSLFTWLYRITVNACRMRQRKRRCVPGAEALEPIDGGFDDQQWLLKQQVDEALRRLPQDLREVLILREMYEMSYEEIAETLQIPVGTVRSRLFAARQRFARIWREIDNKEQS